MSELNRDPTVSTAEIERGTFRFTVILAGDPEPLEVTADKLYEAGCDDALFGTSVGVPTINFTREAASLNHAIMSAIDDIRRADIGLEILRIEPNTALSAEDAREIGKVNDILDLKRNRVSIHEIERLWPRLEPARRLGSLDPTFAAFPPEERAILNKIAVEGKTRDEAVAELGLSQQDFHQQYESALYRLHGDPSCAASLERFRLVEIPEEELKDRSVLVRFNEGPAVLVGPELRYFFECARCGAPLLMGIDVEGTANIRHVVFGCNKCRAFNQLPG